LEATKLRSCEVTDCYLKDQTLCDIHKHSVTDCRYGLLQMVEQSAILEFLSNCVIGLDCSRWSADVLTATRSHRADLWVLQGLCNTRINPTSVSYFLLSPDLRIILSLLELIVRSLNSILVY